MNFIEMFKIIDTNTDYYHFYYKTSYSFMLDFTSKKNFMQDSFLIKWEFPF